LHVDLETRMMAVVNSLSLREAAADLLRALNELDKG
jgi:hypothetical protein